MRYLLFLLLLISSVTYSQSNVDFRGDSARFYKNGGSMEVIIRNSTKDSTNGVLTNIGNGVTRFLKFRVSNDSLFLGNTFIGLIGGGSTDTTYIKYPGLPDTYITEDGDTVIPDIFGYIRDTGLVSVGYGLIGTGGITNPVVIDSNSVKGLIARTARDSLEFNLVLSRYAPSGDTALVARNDSLIQRPFRDSLYSFVTTAGDGALVTHIDTAGLYSNARKFGINDSITTVNRSLRFSTPGGNFAFKNGWVYSDSIKLGTVTPRAGFSYQLQLTGQSYFGSTATFAGGAFFGTDSQSPSFLSGQDFGFNTYDAAGRAMIFRSNRATSGGASGGIFQFVFNNAFSNNAAKARNLAVNIGGTFNPTAFDHDYVHLTLSGVINQTGTANGDVYGIRYAPTLTSILGKNIFLENVTGDNYFHSSSGLSGFGMDTTFTLSSKVDIRGANGYNQLRMRQSYTPTSSADSNGNTGDFAWDENYLYIRTASGGWKRVAITTF